MKKKEILAFLNGKMQEVFTLDTLPPNNDIYPRWYQTIEVFLFKVFGEDSVEYRTFKEAGIIRGIVEDAHTEYLKSIKSREAALASIIDTLETLGDEEPLELKDTVKSPINLFDALKLHPKVVNASRALFENKHYAQAIFEAFKALNNFVKEKTSSSLDGKTLMSRVFRKENPIIKLNELKTQSSDEQEGFMFLFMGAMVGIRNPKAHENIIQTDPYKTLEYLALASLLMRRAEEGTLCLNPLKS